MIAQLIPITPRRVELVHPSEVGPKACHHGTRLPTRHSQTAVGGVVAPRPVVAEARSLRSLRSHKRLPVVAVRGAEHHRQGDRARRGVGRVGRRLGAVELVIQCLLLQKRQHQHAPRLASGRPVEAVRGDARRPTGAGRKDFPLTFVVRHGQPELFEVVLALHFSGCFPCALNGGKQERNENADDRDDHQKLHEREAGGFLIYNF